MMGSKITWFIDFKTKKKHRIGTIIAKEWVFGVIRPPSLSLSILFREYHLTGNYQLKRSPNGESWMSHWVLASKWWRICQFLSTNTHLGNGQSTSYTLTLANGYIYYVLSHDPGCVPNRNIGTSFKPHGDRLICCKTRPSIFKLDKIASASSSPQRWLAIITWPSEKNQDLNGITDGSVSVRGVKCSMNKLPKNKGLWTIQIQNSNMLKEVNRTFQWDVYDWDSITTAWL